MADNLFALWPGDLAFLEAMEGTVEWTQVCPATSLLRWRTVRRAWAHPDFQWFGISRSH